MNRRCFADERGSILLSSLWIVLILALVSLGLMRRSVMEARLFQNFIDQERARALAWAGVSLAAARLQSDQNLYDTRYECGIRLGENESPQSAFASPCTEGRLRVGFETEQGWAPGMRDEDGKLNLNAVTEELLTDLLLRIEVGYDRQAREVAAALLERRSGDAGRPYRFFEELLTVRGMTPALAEKIRPYLTIYGAHNVQINVHTAPRPVLESTAVFAGMSDEGARDVAAEIIRRRSGRDGLEGTPDDVIFLLRGMPDFPWAVKISSDHPGESDALFRFHDFLKTDSSFFSVRAVGKTESNAAVTLDAVFFKARSGATNLVAFHEN